MQIKESYFKFHKTSLDGKIDPMCCKKACTQNMDLKECLVAFMAASFTILYALCGAWGLVGTVAGFGLSYTDCTAKTTATIVYTAPIDDEMCCMTFEYIASRRRHGVDEMPCLPVNATIQICYCARAEENYSTHTGDYFSAHAADAIFQSGLVTFVCFLLATLVMNIQTCRVNASTYRTLT
jgi:hypothetical protein